MIKRGLIILVELEKKIFYLFLNSIDCEILRQGEMRFEKSFKILFKKSMTMVLGINMI